MDYQDNIPVVLVDLPTTIRGFITLGEDYLPCIIINAKMSAELQKETYRHELNHFLRGEMDDASYSEYGDAV